MCPFFVKLSFWNSGCKSLPFILKLSLLFPKPFLQFLQLFLLFWNSLRKKNVKPHGLTPFVRCVCLLNGSAAAAVVGGSYTQSPALSLAHLKMPSHLFAFLLMIDRWTDDQWPSAVCCCCCSCFLLCCCSDLQEGFTPGGWVAGPHSSEDNHGPYAGWSLFLSCCSLRLQDFRTLSSPLLLKHEAEKKFCSCDGTSCT